MAPGPDRNPSESWADSYLYQECLGKYVSKRVHALWAGTACQQVGRFRVKEFSFPPLRRSAGAWKSKAVWTYQNTTISTVLAASCLQQRSQKHKCKLVPSQPTLPETLPKPALLCSSWLRAILNPPKRSDLLLCRHVPERVFTVGTGGNQV